MRHLWICPGLGYKWGMSGILGLSAMAILLHRAINRTDSQITLGYQLVMAMAYLWEQGAMCSTC